MEVTRLELKLSLLLSLSAGKYKNIQAIQDDPLILCPPPDILFAIRALTSLNVSDNNLTDYGNDMSGVEALAAAIPECKYV